jgi:hypothetical protein
MGWVISLCAMAFACLVFVHWRFSYNPVTGVMKRRILEDMFVYIFGVITAQGNQVAFNGN